VWLEVFGLSPLARGTLRVVNIFNCGPRFIPAGAGNTRHRDLHIRQRSVYPRWRGEHGPDTASHLPELGLSPLARGTPEKANDTKAIFPVYPRWRGEHDLCQAMLEFDYGLSPLARGTPVAANYPRQ